MAKVTHIVSMSLLFFSPYLEASRSKVNTSIQRLSGLWSEQQGMWPSQGPTALGPGKRDLVASDGQGSATLQCSPNFLGVHLPTPRNIVHSPAGLLRHKSHLLINFPKSDSRAGNEGDPWSSGSVQTPPHHFGKRLLIHVRGVVNSVHHGQVEGRPRVMVKVKYHLLSCCSSNNS